MTTNNKFQLPESTKNITGGIYNQKIELPFNALYFWVRNGSPELAALKGSTPAFYFGGWATTKNNVEVTQKDIPQDWSFSEMSTKDNHIIDLYTTRNLVIAPIGLRQSWASPDGVRTAEFRPGTRQHVQLLALMGYRDNKKDKNKPWGPVVLSAKGYQAPRLLYAPRDWENLLRPALIKHAPGTPSWAFWLSIGTYGNKMNTESVGKNKTSLITPITIWKPEGNTISESLLDRLFVGSEAAEYMAELNDQAQEWLHAWDSISHHNAPVSEDGHGFDDSTAFDDDQY